MSADVDDRVTCQGPCDPDGPLCLGCALEYSRPDEETDEEQSGRETVWMTREEALCES